MADGDDKAPDQIAEVSEPKKPGKKLFGKGNQWAWKPGQSGNPSGFPKSIAAAHKRLERRTLERFNDLVETMLAQAIGSVEGATANEREGTLRMLASGDVKGNPTLVETILNRVLGRVEMKVALGGGDRPVQLTGTRVDMTKLSTEELKQFQQLTTKVIVDAEQQVPEISEVAVAQIASEDTEETHNE